MHKEECFLDPCAQIRIIGAAVAEGSSAEKGHLPRGYPDPRGYSPWYAGFGDAVAAVIRELRTIKRR